MCHLRTVAYDAYDRILYSENGVFVHRIYLGLTLLLFTFPSLNLRVGYTDSSKINFINKTLINFL